MSLKDSSHSRNVKIPMSHNLLPLKPTNRPSQPPNANAEARHNTLSLLGHPAAAQPDDVHSMRTNPQNPMLVSPQVGNLAHIWMIRRSPLSSTRSGGWWWQRCQSSIAPHACLSEEESFKGDQSGDGCDSACLTGISSDPNELVQVAVISYSSATPSKSNPILEFLKQSGKPMKTTSVKSRLPRRTNSIPRLVQIEIPSIATLTLPAWPPSLAPLLMECGPAMVRRSIQWACFSLIRLSRSSSITLDKHPSATNSFPLPCTPSPTSPYLVPNLQVAQASTGYVFTGQGTKILEWVWHLTTNQLLLRVDSGLEWPKIQSLIKTPDLSSTTVKLDGLRSAGRELAGRQGHQHLFTYPGAVGAGWP
ncbi:fatty acid synthase subunit beta [Puccinia sorghi]|uniref:Fatty acid synthase subunit beta n=1 Tax=Puccinia sorghi TaxID=27349 RepID=A0A0L6UYC2_9BASI|nr:fatty acid synthase subunit beta [Puccinia sorghi]